MFTSEPRQQVEHVDTYLMVFLCDPGRLTLAVVAAVGAAGAVSAAALHQEAAWPENGIGPLELLTQGDGEVPGSAAVQADFLSQQIEIGSASKTQIIQIMNTCCFKTQFAMLNLNTNGSLHLV